MYRLWVMLVAIGILIGTLVSLVMYKIPAKKPPPSYIYQTIEVKYGQEVDFSDLKDEGWSIVGIGYKENKISVILRNRE